MSCDVKSIVAIAVLLSCVLRVNAEALQSKAALEEQAAKSVLTFASKRYQWEQPTVPMQIVGPLYFVGTKGLGAWLFTTQEGHILLNTGMPSSGPAIAQSIRALRYKPEDIKVIINGHAHLDHAGAIGYIKELSGAQLAVMDGDVEAMENGGTTDFQYGRLWRVMGFPGTKVDRVLHDGDTINVGDVLLTAYHTPGHTRGSTTWVTELRNEGREYTVVFPDGGDFNPDYRIARNPTSYPGITDDFRRTLHTWEMLKPDIWLAHHAEFFNFNDKRKQAKADGVNAWIDAEGYRRFVASRRRSFEDRIDRELRGRP